MDGKDIVKIIDARLVELGMTQKEFCAQIGVQSSAMSAWRKGSMPNPQRIAAIEKCLGISLGNYEKSDPREELREDHKMLLKSVDGLPQSSVYEIIAEIHKRREAGWGDPTY